MTGKSEVIKEFQTQISIREQNIAGARKVLEANEKMNKGKLEEIERNEAIIAALHKAIEMQND